MITDLIQIRTLGKKKRDENFRFRQSMKSHSDRVLRRMAEEIEGQIDCTQCANCCKVATVAITERDVLRLARFLRRSREQFLAEYTALDAEGELTLKWSKEAGCIFLNGNDCTVYEARPDNCQRFPHMVRGEGSLASRMWQFVDRACYCPIVYNSLEAFKQHLKFRR